MTQHYHLRSIDPVLPPASGELKPIDVEKLPLPCQRIPPHVSSLKECALWQIQILMAKTDLTEEDEDAIDDGFVLCDLSVVQHKLQVWRRLFPRIKPFFAVKCNPDVMVAAGENLVYVHVSYFITCSEPLVSADSTRTIPTRGWL